MKHLTPSLATLALTGLATASASAASIADDLQLKVKGYIQARATIAASADNTTGGGQDYYATNVPGMPATTPASVPGSESDFLRFSIRRIRLTFEATNSTGWFSNVTLRDEPIEASGGNNPNAGVSIFAAYIGKRFLSDSLEHEFTVGLMKPYNNDSSLPSNNLLFGVDRPVSTLIVFQREPGLSYKLSAPFLRAGVDLQNGTNINRSSPTAASGNADAKPSPFMSARIEASPGAEFMPAKKSESWMGADGTHVVLGGDWQNTGRSYAVTDQQRKMIVYGPDLLIHAKGLTFLAEYRWTHLSEEATGPTGINDSIDGRHWGAQAGYAIPTDMGVTIEPALRFSVMNFDRDQEEHSSWGLNSSRDNAVGNMATVLQTGNLTGANLATGAANLGSGAQLDVGLNLYWNGQQNKTQFGYQRWESEAGAASAAAFYVQQQVIF